MDLQVGSSNGSGDKNTEFMQCLHPQTGIKVWSDVKPAVPSQGQCVTKHFNHDHHHEFEKYLQHFAMKLYRFPREDDLKVF